MLPRLNQLLEALVSGSGASAGVTADPAGIDKRFVPEREASYRQEMSSVHESMSSLDADMQDPEVLEAARKAGFSMDEEDGNEPKQFVVGPDGKLKEQAVEAEVVREPEGRQ